MTFADSTDTPLSPVRSTRAEWVLVLLLGTSSMLSSTIVYVVLCCIAFMYFATSKTKDTTIASMRLLWPLLLLFPIGAIFASQNAIFGQGKDVWYLTKIILLFFVAFVFGSQLRRFDKFLFLYVLLSVLFAAFFLTNLLLSLLNSNGSAFDASYDDIGGFNLAMVFALPVLLKYGRNFQLTRHRGIVAAMVAILLAATLLSFRRTLIISSVVAFAAVFGAFNNRKIVVRTLISIAVVGAIAIAIMIAVSRSGGSLATISIKFLHSFAEISFTSDPRQVIANWRGFEAFMALQGFVNASLAQKILGQGFGATVDLGAFINMSSHMVYRFIPILHNGYFHILTKYGVVGVFLYVVFSVNIIRRKIGRQQMRDGLPSDIMIGCGIIILFTTLVITGLFNKEALDGITMLVGVIYGYWWRIGNGQDAEAFQR